MNQTVRWEIPLSESNFIEDDGRRELGVDILVNGRSKNGNFYSPEVAESFATHLTNRPKVHIDHRDDPQTRRFGRSELDWAATVIEAVGKDGKTVARLDMTKNPRTEWLYEEAKKKPGNVNLSINASVQSAKGTALDGKEANIVEKVLWSEVDFVGYGSAGGKVQRILASEGGMDYDEGDMSLFEGAKTLKGILDQRIKDQKVRNEWYEMWSVVRTMLSSIQTDESLDDKEKDVLVEKGMDEFKKKVQSFDLGAIYGKRGDEIYASMAKDISSLGGFNIDESVVDAYVMVQGLSEVDWESAEISDISEVEFSKASWASVKKSDLPASAFLIVGDKDKKATWHLPYRDMNGKVNLGALRALSVIVKSGQFRGEKLSFSIPPTVRSKIEGLLKSAKIGKSPISATVTKKESKGGGIMEKGEWIDAVKENADWVSDLPGVVSTEKFTDLKESFEKQEKILSEVKGQLDDEKLRRETIEKAQRVNGFLKESSLKEDQIKDGFRDRLMDIEKDEEIKEAITSREALIKGVIETVGGKVEDNGSPKSKEGEKKVDESEKALTDDEASARLK